jgi:hypothetical protein
MGFGEDQNDRQTKVNQEIAIYYRKEKAQYRQICKNTQEKTNEE